ncbi:MAG TPA: transglutaminase-like cysteine peptidase [Geminicoccus sp.]|jgi:predicted transglutaminase-like cysteine proteinase|uniref:transglutaminase-like cysteine peptidase n=1 Tax=Geminicoccus sp. TaxID=2024832 RepID=UPI002E3209E4|nr:transglutaminase-like cysteine peptidase [Geminicoccus sp.]HEX2524699.1 transglutaminase-like cysteine peptidase [Geminicoccus sp.]
MMRRIIILSLATTGLVLAYSQSLLAAGLPAVFNTVEVRADRQLALPQWRRVLEKIEAEQPVYAACAEARPACTSRAAVGWQVLLVELQGLDRLDQVKAVNRFVNRIPYQPDMAVWGKSDYWASPLEFLRLTGDCEDYAILKYRSLRQLGVPASDMRMVVVQDTSRDLAHAVLVVMVQDHLLVLDNLTNALLPQERTPHYVPYYSVNEDARWAHLASDGQHLAALRKGAAAR